MKIILRVLTPVMCLLFSLSVNAVTSAYQGKILGVRVEATTGLISLATPISDGDPACGRVWLDLLDESDRVAYSTFLMAFASNQTVEIRAKAGTDNKRYGACEFYDVYIPAQ